MHTTGYQFTQDWFNQAEDVWPHLRQHMPKRHAFLEIGSYEGRSTVWTVEHLMEDGGYIDCIDTWEGGEEHGGIDMPSVEARFDHNTEQVMRKFSNELGVHREVRKLKGTSTQQLGNLICSAASGRYDFIYIDGSHVAKDVLTDACLAFELLAPGGLMVFDDYLWGDARDALHRPKLAVDSFTNIFSEHIDTLHIGYQYALKKR